MTEYDFTTGTKILTLATIILFLVLSLTIFFYPNVWWLTAIPAVLAAIATYSAATDRDMSVFFYRGRFQKSQYVGESSAACTFSVLSFGIMIIVVMVFTIVILDPPSDPTLSLITVLSYIGVILTMIGGVIANREWNE